MTKVIRLCNMCGKEIESIMNSTLIISLDMNHFTMEKT